MNELLAAEWIKISHRWMPRILMILQIVIIFLVLLATGLATHLGDDDLLWPNGMLLGMEAAGLLSVLIMSWLGGAWAGNEYSWGTLRLLLTIKPNRTNQFLAGYLTLLGFILATLLVAIVMGAVGGIIAGAAGAAPGFLLYLLKGFGAELLAMGFFALVAYTAGAIFKSAIAGVGTGIGVWIVGHILQSLFILAGGILRVIGLHFPYYYAESFPSQVMAPAFRGDIASAGGPGAIPDLLGVVIYSGIVLAIGLYIVYRRDVTA